MRLLDILHKPAELWSLGLERLKRSLGYGDKSRRLAECQATIDQLNARVELLTSELEKRTAELEKHKTATGNMWKFIHRRHRLDLDPEKGTIRNVLVATGRRVERKAKALIAIAATVLALQSSYGQAIWRNYWTTNQNPQITPSLLATNSASANQVLTATSANSAAWKSPIEGEWSFIHIPDWQTATSNQMRISIDNLMTNNWNPRVVLFSGDLLGTATNITDWQSATSAVYRLAVTNPVLYVPGNHELGSGPAKDYTYWDTYFPSTFWTDKSWWSGSFASNSTTSAGQSFSITNGLDKWLFVTLDCAFNTNQMLWASNAIASRPDHNAVIVTHQWQTHNGSIYSTADAFSAMFTDPKVVPTNAWASAFSHLANLRIVLSGHDLFTDTATTTIAARDGHAVQMFFLNHQQAAFPGQSVARVFTITNGVAKASTVNLYNMSYIADGGGYFEFPIVVSASSAGAFSSLSIDDNVLAESLATTNLNGPSLKLRQFGSGQIPTNTWSIGVARHSSGELEIRNGANQAVISNAVVAVITNGVLQVPGGIVAPIGASNIVGTVPVTSTNAENATNFWGQLSVTNYNNGTSASESTYLRGDGTWAAASGGGAYNMLLVSQSSLLTTNVTYSYGGTPGNVWSSSSEPSRAQMIPKTGTITVAAFASYNFTAQISGIYNIRLRINNTTDLTLGDVIFPAASTTNYLFTGLSQAVTAGDTISIKVVGPTYDTPANLPTPLVKINVFIE